MEENYNISEIIPQHVTWSVRDDNIQPLLTNRIKKLAVCSFFCRYNPFQIGGRFGLMYNFSTDVHRVDTFKDRCVYRKMPLFQRWKNPSNLLVMSGLFVSVAKAVFQFLSKQSRFVPIYWRRNRSSCFWFGIQ